MSLLAHAAPISYRFPLPIWIYVLAAGTAVGLSAPAAAFAVREGERPAWRSRNLYPGLRRLRLGPIGLVLSTILLGFVLLGGLGGRTVQAREFFENPQGLLGTVYTDGWHAGGDILLSGDAAHAIVPFHGQGMNCAFEDCVELDAMIAQSRDWAGVFARFERGPRLARLYSPGSVGDYQTTVEARRSQEIESSQLTNSSPC